MKANELGFVKALHYNSQQELCLYGKSLGTLCQNGAGPAYVYSRPGIKERLALVKQQLTQELPFSWQLHYAMKANNNHEILRWMQEVGFGLDLVSGGELNIADQMGFSSERLIYSGVGKSAAELRAAIKKDILQINVESLGELKKLASLGGEVRVGLRMNPNLDAKTHPYIATGLVENKFGLDVLDLPEALRIINMSPGIELKGLSLHLGSQVSDQVAIEKSIDFLLNLSREVQAQGFQLATLDLGGGWPLNYEEEADQDGVSFSMFLELLKRKLNSCPYRVLFEPGRFLVGRGGVLLTQVLYIKTNPKKNFIIVNTGMHHFMRPVLYGAFHRILPVVHKKNLAVVYDIVGPVCESADFLGKNRALPQVQEGDWLVIADAGAYGYVMANRYNSFDLPREEFI